jgi:hypothetical protein
MFLVLVTVLTVLLSQWLSASDNLSGYGSRPSDFNLMRNAYEGNRLHIQRTQTHALQVYLPQPNLASSVPDS